MYLAKNNEFYCYLIFLKPRTKKIKSWVICECKKNTEADFHVFKPSWGVHFEKKIGRRLYQMKFRSPMRLALWVGYYGKERKERKRWGGSRRFSTSLERKWISGRKSLASQQSSPHIVETLSSQIWSLLLTHHLSWFPLSIIINHLLFFNFFWRELERGPCLTWREESISNISLKFIYLQTRQGTSYQWKIEITFWVKIKFSSMVICRKELYQFLCWQFEKGNLSYKNTIKSKPRESFEFREITKSDGIQITRFSQKFFTNQLSFSSCINLYLICR